MCVLVITILVVYREIKCVIAKRLLLYSHGPQQLYFTTDANYYRHYHTHYSIPARLSGINTKVIMVITVAVTNCIHGMEMLPAITELELPHMLLHISMLCLDYDLCMPAHGKCIVPNCSAWLTECGSAVD